VRGGPNSGWEDARRAQLERDGRPGDDFDVMTDFFHDVPPEVVAKAFSRGELSQSGTPFGEPLPLRVWPDVPIKFLLCRNDRSFLADFMRRVVQQRLGIKPDEMDCGHLPALRRPQELVERLEASRTSLPD
jgi:Alpha/beta hydrolase family